MLSRGYAATHHLTIEHGVREGVRGMPPQNDTIRFTQVFDNYYAYDDGTPENGYVNHFDQFKG